MPGIVPRPPMAPALGRAAAHSPAPMATPPPAPAPAAAGLPFEYVGATALTVIGPATGKRYRFERTGATVSIDPRDAPAFSVVPNVRRVWT